jgi:hypothetical protein
MLRQTIAEESTYPSHYVPVPRKDEMSEAHVEDYLDHFCAPLVGKVSYEERVKMREELRAQIESVITAHVELGSAREQAIAFTLQQFSHVPAVTPAALAPVALTPVHAETVTEVAPVTIKRRHLALQCFGLSTALSFIAAMSLSEDQAMGSLLLVILAGLPFLAGLTLGYRKPDRPMRSMLKTLGWLALPTLLMSWIFCSGASSGNPFAAGVAASTCFLAGSCLFGGIGTKIGKWMRTTGFLDKIDPPYPARVDNGPHRLP